MNWVKGFALATILAMPLPVIASLSASAEPATDTKPAATAEKKAPTKDQMAAYQTKCSVDADAKGLKGKAKAEERKTFRTACIKKLRAEGM